MKRGLRKVGGGGDGGRGVPAQEKEGIQVREIYILTLDFVV